MTVPHGFYPLYYAGFLVNREIMDCSTKRKYLLAYWTQDFGKEAADTDRGIAKLVFVSSEGRTMRGTSILSIAY